MTTARVWSIVDGWLQTKLDTASPDGTPDRRTLIALQEWEARGLAQLATDGSHVRLSPELWEASLAATNDLDADLRSALDALLDAPAAEWSVASRSFVGAPRLDVEVKHNGSPVTWTGMPAIGNTAGLQPLTPETAALLKRVHFWGERLEHPEVAQWRMLGELQHLAVIAATTTQRVTLDPHLAGFEIEHAESVRLAWEPSQRNPNVFDLRAEVRTAGGQTRDLPPAAIHGTDPVAKDGAKRVLLFDDDTAAAVRHVSRKQQSRSRRQVADVLRDPAAALPAGVASENIDLSEYSHRISGFERVVRASRAEDIQSSGVRWFDEGASDTTEAFLELDLTSDPSTPPVCLRFDTPEDATQARDTLDRELSRPAPATVKIAEAEVVPTAPLRDRLSLELAAYAHGRPLERKPSDDVAIAPPPRLTAVIDEDAVFASDEGRALLEAVPWQRLDGMLAPGITLKPHQREGVAWLWHHLRHGAPGVLLADDMGLGKTLQVACLLALHRDVDTERRPSLVVLPVILIENWLNELVRFFRPEAVGALTVLHGAGLQQLRNGNGLAIERLREADLVIANYETLARYQLDLLKLDWRTVVLDEAHNIKSPDALRTRAACGLKRQFAVSLTGTPVENRLLDLWTQFFFLSPRHPFGTRQDFARDYTGPKATATLRTALDYPSPTSRVLRRSKGVLALPPKTMHEHVLPMTDVQAGLERRLVDSAGTTPEGHLRVLGLLRRLYAHPWLLEKPRAGESPRNVRDAARWSPKFAKCLDLLDGVRRRNEKALVFSLFVDMQALLVDGIRDRFGLKRVHVVNGDANQHGSTGRMLDDFRKSDGFDVIVLSPIAAGVGLNITEANHVIHYDRWWNPAKEDQATDRAYRIGQEKEVHVHHLLLHRPDAPDAGFDRKLHDLVTAKRALARDFLSPADGLELQPGDLLRALHGA